MTSAPHHIVPQAELTVKRVDFAEALHRVERASRFDTNVDLELTWSEGFLHLNLPRDSQAVPANGSWPLPVRLSASILTRLRKSLPSDDPLILRVRGDRFSVGSLTLPCRQTGSMAPVSDLRRELNVISGDPFAFLRACSRYSREELEAAGAVDLVESVERRLHDLCAEAVDPIRRFGVTTEDLKELCMEHIRSGERDFSVIERGLVNQVAKVWKNLAVFGVEPKEIGRVIEDRVRNAWK